MQRQRTTQIFIGPLYHTHHVHTASTSLRAKPAVAYPGLITLALRTNGTYLYDAAASLCASRHLTYLYVDVVNADDVRCSGEEAAGVGGVGVGGGGGGSGGESCGGGGGSGGDDAQYLETMASSVSVESLALVLEFWRHCRTHLGLPTTADSSAAESAGGSAEGGADGGGVGGGVDAGYKFRVKCKRGGDHDFSSDHAKRAAARGLAKSTGAAELGFTPTTKSNGSLLFMLRIHHNTCWLGLAVNERAEDSLAARADKGTPLATAAVLEEPAVIEAVVPGSVETVGARALREIQGATK